MKKIAIFLGILFLLVACKKEKIDSNGFGNMGCVNAYEKNSTPIDLSLYDSVKWFWDHGCMTMEPISADTMFSNVVVNPNNPFEVIYSRIIDNNGVSNKVYKYNFCNSEKTLLLSLNGLSIYGNNQISWGKNEKIFYISGIKIMSMSENGGSIKTLIPNNGPPPYPQEIFCNPIGTLFLVSYSNSPQEDSNKIFKENGTSFFTLPNQANFLGWYDNTHVLTNFDNKVMKVNVLTGEQDLFLTGTYYSYDYKTHQFLKYHDSSGYTNWLICNEAGEEIISTPYHYGKGVWYVPQFVSNNKMIAYLSTDEFYPNKHIPSCQLFQRDRIAVMNEDGTEVRVVNFPE